MKRVNFNTKMINSAKEICIAIEKMKSLVRGINILSMMVKKSKKKKIRSERKKIKSMKKTKKSIK